MGTGLDGGRRRLGADAMVKVYKESERVRRVHRDTLRTYLSNVLRTIPPRYSLFLSHAWFEIFARETLEELTKFRPLLSFPLVH